MYVCMYRAKRRTVIFSRELTRRRPRRTFLSWYRKNANGLFGAVIRPEDDEFIVRSVAQASPLHATCLVWVYDLCRRFPTARQNYSLLLREVVERSDFGLFSLSLYLSVSIRLMYTWTHTLVYVHVQYIHPHSAPLRFVT